MLFFGPVQGTVVDVVTRLATPRQVLDIGCGTGRLLSKVGTAMPGATMAGIDRSAGMLSAARRIRPALLLSRGTAEALPYPDGSFDLVTTTVSFHHWSDKPAALGEVRRVLRPGGLLALADPALDDIPRWLDRIRPRIHHGGQVLPLEERHRMIEAAGMRVRQVTRTFLGRWVPLTVAERTA